MRERVYATLRVVGYEETRKIDATHDPKTGRITELKPVEGSEQTFLELQLPSGAVVRTEVAAADYDKHFEPLLKAPSIEGTPSRFQAMERLGAVSVDSGTLLVIDPCYLAHWGSDAHPDLSDKGWHAAFAEGRQQLNFANGVKAAVIIKGFGGDGSYPVLVEKRPDGSPSIGSFAVDLTPETTSSIDPLAARVAARFLAAGGR